MAHPFKIGSKVRCIEGIGELIYGNTYTVRQSPPESENSVYLEESRYKSYNYNQDRFELICEPNKFEDSLKKAKDLVGKTVLYERSSLKVDNVIVFIKGVENDLTSGLVQDALETQDWCIAVKSTIQTIPIDLVTLIETVNVKNVGDYEAIVHKDFVMVGCQKISKEKFDEITKAFDSLK